MTFHATACPHDCPSTCALEVERLDSGRIGKVRGAEANSYTAGVICAKVSRYAERVHHPDRLTRPLIRLGAKGEGRWGGIGWDEALDLVAEKFRDAAARHGSEAVWPYFYSGTMGLVQRDGIQRLRHVMRYSGQGDTICDILANVGWKAGCGAIRGTDPREMAESDLIVSWGGNPVATQVNVMTHVSRARKARGAQLVQVDPYRNATAQVADLHLMLRPGTDGALACAVMHVLFREGYADREYLARYTDAPAELEAHLAGRTPEWAASITGLRVAEIEEFARLYGRTQRSYIRLGYGFTRSRNGAAQMHAVSCLPAVTGAWRHRGGGAFYCSSDIYALDRTIIMAQDRADPSVRELDMAQIGRVLTGDAQALKGGPPVTAMLVQNVNPAAVAPESALVRQGLAREDLFLCVHEQFMTDTAKLADLVLPATMFVEHDDIYKAGGQMHLQLGPKIVDPPEGCRSNHQVINALGKRLGAEHPAFDMTELELIDAMLRASGLGTVEELRERRWIDCQPPFEEAHFLNGFAFPDGRFRFKPDWASLGMDHAAMPRLPDHMDAIEKADAEHPFRLVTAPARQFLNTSFSLTRTSVAKEGRPTAKIHPDDCAALGLEAGAPVRIGNRRGSVVVHVEPFAGLQRGVVIVESIWPNDAFVEGMGINVLIGADRAPPVGGAVFHDTAVWMRAA